ncbi:ATPase inhibitor mai-1, mitochondrial [Caenorhabditis elegans]|uniref:ATPase inhibitor mai-1, mitochondrial n=1 Tax=Caenorhabditis elegans TaxID=6239 RepID=ATIF1_CAEEL|nr:ATPase inhibitor mai-1, mitochondrial [Caenorhabditis elegans]P37209.1 RecName: Full=ATPase inhibitor mai-1, mitochondrial; AltName: Full=ATP synthase F1 subunit epsilon; Flags: Precursor [Caenorhabditis elegans]AAA28107.1 ATPase inhibitor [Caenorhabditis elegans]CCD64601.1 ATPase inhibitor mai-1, mitochondrial [Caenorhabditis elegans]|eukprot:NP_508536.1 ATPase inhibitor mai-1, mitochondrial [Caenorhabditis elegans]
MSGSGSGSGAGHGGGSGGSIREAGGSLGMMGATREEEYFRRQQKDQLDNLKKKLEADMTQSQQEIRDHEKVLEQHQQRLKEIEKGHGT